MAILVNACTILYLQAPVVNKLVLIDIFSFIICIKMNIYCCKILFYFVCGVYHNQSFNTLILQN